MRLAPLFPLVLLASSACTKSNPDYCTSQDECSNGLVCYEPSHTCVVPTDGSIPDATMCFGPAPYEVCLRELPTESLTLPSLVVTDMNGPLCNKDPLWASLDQDNACFIAAANITIPAVRVDGTRPLVLVATGSIDVAGYVDGAAHVFPYAAGPGAPANYCGPYQMAPQDAEGAGGGAGASFRTGGGRGGTGNGGFASGGQNNVVQPVPTRLRGGCAGQNGGNGLKDGGVAGNGGGAIYLLSAGTLRLGANSIVNVSGAGAGSPGRTGGGGGGGSGGMILLVGAAITVEPGARLVANGGGGSSGGGATNDGVRGADPDPTNPLVPAPGGNGVAAAGGHGYAEGTPVQSGFNSLGMEGGGGGGGGGGYIRANQELTNATVSPQAHIVP